MLEKKEATYEKCVLVGVITQLQDEEKLQEYMDELEFLAFPRLPGYAEIGWSAPENRTWDDYKVRLGKHGQYMSTMGIDFYRSKLVPWSIEIE